MPFTRPTLTQIADRIQQDIASRLELVSPILRRAFVHVFGRAFAGAAHMLHGHLDFLAKQVFPDLSDREFLVRHAAVFGISRKPASFAKRDVTFTGTNGAVVPAGTVLLRADGAEYTTGADATIVAGTATATVTARAAGADGSLTAGAPLTFESPIPGVNASATVASSGTVDGADEETDDALRTRFLARLRAPPHGGAASDYVAWALEVAGVTRAWCYPLEGGAGTVTVRFVRDDDASIIPDAAEVAAVQAHIDDVRPVTAIVTVAAPIADALNFTIHIVPDTAENRAAVTAELTDLLRRLAKPGGTIPVSQIRGAVDDAAGLTDWTVTAPAADVTHATGHIAVMGSITWV